MCTSSNEGTDVAASAASRPGPPTSPELIADLVVANRVLLDQGVVDAFGHVSVRHDKRADRFLLARNMAPGLVTAADILEFDLEGNPVVANGPPVYLERFIHGQIYRARPDVMAVVHSHSPAVVPFGVVPSVPLKPVWHMSGFLGETTPIFEIRSVAGNASDLLITDNRLGTALAQSLGANSVVLMRGHGATIAGASLPQAVYRAVYTEMNARLQLEAMGLGPVNYLTKGEIEATTVSVGSQIKRAWDFWKMRVAGSMR